LELHFPPDKTALWQGYKLSGKPGTGKRRRHIRKAERTDWTGRKIGKEDE